MASQGTHMYFILIKKPKSIGIINAGSICYISETRYTSILRRNDGTLTKLPMTRIGDSFLQHDLDLSDMEPLTIQAVELLLAVKDESERLKWFIEKETLQTSLGLAVHTSVTVEEKGASLKGIIRSICRLTVPEGHQSLGLSAVFFGIELQGKDKGKGQNDGTYKSRTFFKCPRDCGVMAPFSKVRPVVYRAVSPSEPLLSTQTQAEPLALGDRVTFMFDEEHFGRGMVMDVGERGGQQMVRLSTDTDKNGVRGGETEVPLDCVFKVKEEVDPEGDLEPERMDTDAPLPVPALDTHPMDLGVDSMVEVSLASGNTYGIIRWVGTLPGRREEAMAGLELEDNVGVSDGTFFNERFFQCPPGRALFIKLLSCRPDSRFQNQSADCERERKQSGGKPKNPTDSRFQNQSANCERERKQSGGKPKKEPIAPITTDRVTEVLIGEMKGIQGHCNSCYMDATLFSLFSCSSVLDSLLFMSTEPRDAHIQGTLLYDIVNPLRSEGFVEGKHIMKLRQQLQEHGYSRTFTTDEKDPEEFLTVIMHHILALEPLLKLSAGGKVQESYCYQIFLEQNHSLVLPTVQQLLEHSFHSAGLKLAEVPSCLILQMPRFGKKFKMFDKIIPSLQLDITDLLSEGPQQCRLCGQLAYEECVDCFKDPLFGQTGFKLFCRTCSSQVHAHPQRRAHRPTLLDMPKGFPTGHTGPQVLARDKLELFAVLCIETSHYVSFIKHGPNNHDWIFFDSMADRHGGIDGFNIPQVQACPEVGAYLEMSPAELASHVPRDMKGVAKRLFCDAYMYLYQSTTMCLYR